MPALLMWVRARSDRLLFSPFYDTRLLSYAGPITSINDTQH